jgi:ribosome modulation factor
MAINFDRAPYLNGYEAGLDNKSLDNCRYTKTKKRISWMAGYQSGKLERERRINARYAHTEQAKQNSLKWLNICKQKAHLTT